MQLPFLKKTEPEKNFFLALLIKPHKVGAILFEEINSKLFILANNEVTLTKDTSELSSQELLESADKVITSVESSLPEGATLEKTIFSVPYDWIEEGKIKKEYLGKLKKVCEDLGLAPVGYLVSIEAIVAFLAQSEGVPVSAIFVEVAGKKVFLYLVRGGKILEVQAGAIEDKLLATVESLLKKVEGMDVLPSKIILLDYKESDGTQQEFLSHTWSKDIPFLHLPQVVVLEQGFENEATVNGVAAQMELEVLQDIKTIQTQSDNLSEEVLEEKSPADFGFFKEKDVVEDVKKEDATAEDEISDKENKSDREKVSEDSNIEPAVSYFKEGEEDTPREPQEVTVSKNLQIPFLPQIALIAQKIKIPNLKTLPFISGGKVGKSKVLIAVAASIAFIIAFIFIYYNFIVGARVVVLADKKAIDETANVVFAENSTSGDAIKIAIVEEKIKGEDTKNSTGTRETGDKAAGAVTIFNKGDTSKTFPKGTIVISSKDLEFETQSDTTVASTSAFSTTLSSSNVKVQATKIGREYNLPSNSNFTVKGFSASDYIAKNSDTISGGTKKEITVVSRKDLDGLLSSVISKLEKDAISKAKSSASSEEAILPKALSTSVTTKSYSKKENDESGSVSVTAEIKYSIGKYTKSDLDEVVKSLSEGEIPGSYSLVAGDSQIDITDLKIEKNNTAAAKLHVKAIYTPNIESKTLAAQIKGKSLKRAETEIKGIAGVTDVSIVLTNSLPFMPKFLPQNLGRISIEARD